LGGKPPSKKRGGSSNTVFPKKERALSIQKAALLKKRRFTNPSVNPFKRPLF